MLASIAQHGVRPDLLCFEITETQAIGNLAQAREFMQTLHDAGCRFSLDDFGSGYASFAYLRELPFDTLKIDGLFARDMQTEPTHQAMVRSMVDMARLLDKPVVAEFVETASVAQLLRELGVQWGQGYYFHQPEPLTFDALKAFLKERLGKHEMIGAIDVRAELPKTAVGKLSKKDLYTQELGAA